MREAPAIGDEIEIDGVLCRRLPSDFRTQTDDQRTHAKYPHVDYTLPHKKHLPQSIRDRTKFTKTGQPIISSKQHENQVAGALGLKRLT